MEIPVDLITDPPPMVIIIGGFIAWCSAWVLLALVLLAVTVLGTLWAVRKTGTTCKNSMRYHPGRGKHAIKESTVEETTEETFGPEYIRPARRDCPNCECCKEPLCEKGKNSPIGCASYVDDECRADDECLAAVRECPCSSEASPGTVAYQAAQALAVWHATEKPLGDDDEKTLRAIAEEQETDVKTTRVLQAWRYITPADGTFSVTDSGRTYLETRDASPPEEGRPE